MKKFRILIPVAISFIAGLVCGYFYWNAHRDDDRYIHFVQVEGRYIGGAYWRLDASEIKKIEYAVSKIIENKYPIQQMEVIDAEKVEVTTGETRGPLDGNGNTYIMKRKNGTWTVESSSVWFS